MVNFYVFPYRDMYFQNKFGPIVRDLMIIQAIEKLDVEKNIFIFNRPVSLYERLSTKRNFFIDIKSCTVVHDTTSFDLLGPLSGRAWCKNVYAESYSAVKLDSNATNVVLDFLPIGYLPKWANDVDYYWYDFIDNFTKHNRYTEYQKLLVLDKYNHLTSLNNVHFTAVKNDIIQTDKPYLEVLNALTKKVDYFSGPFDYDFGFMGFITDKFDIALIELISALGYSVCVYGKSYCRDSINRLKSIKNVSVFGAFSDSEVNSILKKFKVGLVPYIKEKMHDESPLKIFQYISSGKFVLSTSDFGMSSQYIISTDKLSMNDLTQKIEALAKGLIIDEFSASQFAEENSWKSRVECIFDWMFK